MPHRRRDERALVCLDDLRAAITGDPQFATVSRVDLAAIRASLDDTMTLGLGLGYILCSQLAGHSTGPKADRNAQREATS